MVLSLSPARLTRTLACVVALLTVAHLAGLVSIWRFGHDSVFGLVPLFDLRHEANVPTFHASLSFVLCALLTALAAGGHAQRGEPFVRHWTGLSFLFLFLALDEFAGLHERINDPLVSALNTKGLLTNAWVIPYSLGCVLLFLVYLPFLRALPANIRRVLVWAGLTFVAGAIGLEVLVGPAKAAAAGKPSLVVAAWNTAEEVLEMVGVVLAIHGLATYVASRQGGLLLRLSGNDERPSAGLSRESAVQRLRSTLAAELVRSTRPPTTTNGDDTGAADP